MTDDIDESHGRPPLFHIAAFPRTLLQRWRPIALTVVAVMLATGAYLVLTKPMYTATASILVDPRDSPGVGADSAWIASQVSVINSRAILGKVFDRQDLADYPEFTRRGFLPRIMALVRPAKPLTADAIYGNFARHVSIEREGLSYVIDISVSLQDPAEAATIANAIVERYKASLEAERESANNKVTSLLADKISGLQTHVSDAEGAVEDFKSQNRIDASAGDTLRSQVDQLSTQLGSAEDRADQAESRYQQAVQAGDTPKGFDKLSNILPSATAEGLRQEYNQRATALANAEMVYGARHPVIVRLKAELARTRGLMAQEADRITQQLGGERDLARRNVTKLKSKLAALRRRSNRSELAQVKLHQLERRADAARALLNDFLKRSQETTRLGGMQLSQVRVINRATPPTEPTWPNKKLLVPVGLFLGLLAGCCLGLLADPKNRRVVRGTAVAAAAGSRQATPLVPLPAHAGLLHSGQQSGLSRLGTYILPAYAGQSARSTIKAMRSQLAEKKDSTLYLAVLKLIRHVISRLSQHDEPFVLMISSIDRGVERKLAAALIGIGLQRLEETVLLVEIAKGGEEPSPLHSVSAHRGTGVFVDHASGLSMIVVPEDSLKDVAPIDAILAKAGARFDFVVVIARPVGEAGYGTGLEAEADLTVFALSATEDEWGASEWLEDRLRDEGLDDKAIIVLERSANEDGKSRFGPCLVTSDIQTDADEAAGRA